MGCRRYIRWFVIALAVTVAGLVALGLRLHWAASPPSRPKNLPADAIWVPVPPTPLEFTPNGYWLACWFDPARNVDRCETTDYKGKQEYVADYAPLNGPNPVPEDLLKLKPVESTFDLFAFAGDTIEADMVPIARLEDGTILVPSRDLAAFRKYPPKSQPESH